MAKTEKMMRLLQKKQEASMRYYQKKHGKKYMDKVIYKPQAKPGPISYTEIYDRSICVFYPKRDTPKEAVQDYEMDFIKSLQEQRDRDDGLGLKCLIRIIEDIKKCRVLHRLIKRNLLLNAYLIMNELES